MITKHPTSRTLIVHPLGDLDTLRADHYRRQLRSLIDEGYRFLIFDMQDTPYINSSGLGLLIELYNKAIRQEGSVKLINCSPHVQRILEQTQLNRILIDKPESGAVPGNTELHYDTIYSLISEEMLLLAQVYDLTEKILGLDDTRQIGELTLRGIHQALHATRGALFLLSPDGRRLVLAGWVGADETASPPRLEEIPLQPGRLEHRVLEQNEVAWHELCDQDKSENNLCWRLGFETLILAPIHGHHNRFGLLIVEAGPDTVKLIQTSRPIVRTFANICGLAMEKTELNQQLRDRNDQLNALIERAHDYHQTLLGAGKLAALGVVTSGLSHLINNKISPLLGYTQLLAQNKDLSESVSEKVAHIQASGNEINRLVAKISRISRCRDRAGQPIDSPELIRVALNLLTFQIERDDISVQLNTTGESPAVRGNPDMVLQALLAILHRSCTSFTPENRERWISIICQGSEDGLKIIIEDNGAGFDEYDQEGALDPIVPTEAMDNGRIFNYTIPRAIIKKSSGSLTLQSPNGSGKRVIIDLPAEKKEGCRL